MTRDTISQHLQGLQEEQDNFGNILVASIVPRKIGDVLPASQNFWGEDFAAVIVGEAGEIDILYRLNALARTFIHDDFKYFYYARVE